MHLKEVYGKFEIENHGFNGYTRTVTFNLLDKDSLVRIEYNPDRLDMGLSIDFRGNPKKYYEQVCEIKGIKVNWKEIISQVVKKYGGHLSRIDIAVDFIDFGYSVNSISEKLKNEEYYFLNKNKQRIDIERIKTIGKGKKTETIYVGSRTSGAYLRIYNKKKEQLETRGIFHAQATVCENWVRVEGEFHHKKSQRIGKLIAYDSNSMTAILASYLSHQWSLVTNND